MNNNVVIYLMFLYSSSSIRAYVREREREKGRIYMIVNEKGEKGLIHMQKCIYMF
jgi:hypothetical protein